MVAIDVQYALSIGAKISDL